MPLGMLYTYVVPFYNKRYNRLLYISAWGFGVARSNSDGQCESLCDVERATGMTPTSFFYIYV